MRSLNAFTDNEYLRKMTTHEIIGGDMSSPETTPHVKEDYTHSHVGGTSVYDHEIKRNVVSIGWRELAR